MNVTTITPPYIFGQAALSSFTHIKTLINVLVSFINNFKLSQIITITHSSDDCADSDSKRPVVKNESVIASMALPSS